MKIVLSALIIFLSVAVSAQDTIIKKYNSGEIASIEIIPIDQDRYPNGFEKEQVEVYDKAGNRVFKGYRRNFWGHSSVYLTYHKNGGVKNIQTSTAPDAGIQWYRSTYLLDEEGNVIKFTEDSHERLLGPSNRFRTEIEETKDKKEEKIIHDEETVTVKENACAVLKQTQVYLFNKSKQKIEIKLHAKVYHNMPPAYLTVASGDSVQLGTYNNAEIFKQPEDLFGIEIKQGKRGKYLAIQFSDIPVRLIQQNPQIKIYAYYWVD